MRLVASVVSNSLRLIDCSPPGSSVHGSLQPRKLEWVAMPPSRGSSQSRDSTHVSYVPCIGRQVLSFFWAFDLFPLLFFLIFLFLKINLFILIEG